MTEILSVIIVPYFIFLAFQFVRKSRLNALLERDKGEAKLREEILKLAATYFNVREDEVAISTWSFGGEQSDLNGMVKLHVIENRDWTRKIFAPSLFCLHAEFKKHVEIFRNVPKSDREYLMKAPL